MSVTFAVAVPVEHYTLTCSCGAASYGPFDTSAEAYALLAAGSRPSCGDEYCFAYQPSVNAVSASPELNMANSNAREVLAVLGFADEDLCGSADGDDLLGRILMAQAINPSDPGRPAVGEGNYIDCGRSVGYIDTRLDELKAIAEFAREASAEVYWG